MTWMFLSEAIHWVTFAAAGRDGWEELKREMFSGEVAAVCRRNGQIIPLKPEWLAYIKPFAEKMPPVVTSEYRFGREYLQQFGEAVPPFPETEILRDIPTTDAPTDNTLWFEKRLGYPVDIPSIVTEIEVCREQVWKLWPLPKVPLGTVRDEQECRRLLADLMKAGPPTKSKAKYRAEFKLGIRPFNRAWERARDDVGPNHGEPWGRPGRRS